MVWTWPKGTEPGTVTEVKSTRSSTRFVVYTCKENDTIANVGKAFPGYSQANILALSNLLNCFGKGVTGETYSKLKKGTLLVLTFKRGIDYKGMATSSK